MGDTLRTHVGNWSPARELRPTEVRCTACPELAANNTHKYEISLEGYQNAKTGVHTIRLNVNGFPGWHNFSFDTRAKAQAFVRSK